MKKFNLKIDKKKHTKAERQVNKMFSSAAGVCKITTKSLFFVVCTNMYNKIILFKRFFMLMPPADYCIHLEKTMYLLIDRQSLKIS